MSWATGTVNAASPVNWSCPVLNGLRSWWHADTHPSGRTGYGGSYLLDLCQVGNHASLAGFASWGAGFNGGGAMSLAGSAVNGPVVNGIVPTTITIFARVCVTTAANNPIFENNGNTGYRFRINADGSATFFDRGGTNSLNTAASAVPVGKWVSIAAVGVTAGLRIYVKESSTLVSATNSTAYGAITSGTTNIGYSPQDGAGFTGFIGSIMLFERGLLQNEFEWLHNEAVQNFPNALNRLQRKPPGTFSSGGITGTLNVTQAGNTLSASATNAIAATASLTQAGNTTTTAATNAIAASASLSQASETISAAATNAVAATSSLTQSSETISGAGTNAIAATATKTQAGDSASSAGTNAVVGSLGSTQAGNTSTGSGANGTGATCSLTQADETASASAANAIGASASLTQAVNPFSGIATNAIAATLNKTQADQTLAATGGSSSGSLLLLRRRRNSLAM